METIRPRFRDDFPYPVAHPYALIFDPTLSAPERRWALCFTQYQTLRMLVLPLVSQYIREPIDEAAKESVRIVNERIASLRSPMFSDWITAIRTLPRQWTNLNLPLLFPGLLDGLKSLSVAEARSVARAGQKNLDPLEAILALRNATAHGGIPKEDEATRHLAEYLPVLHQVLSAFDFLGDCALQVCEDRERALQGLPVGVRRLRGAMIAEVAEESLTPEVELAFADSPAVLVTPAGKALPLYPLLNRLPQTEPLYLYDGHYGIRVEAKKTVESRYIYYLGIYDKQTESGESRDAAERLRELLAARHISYDLPKEKVAPWTISESALDYSRRTLEDLRGSKYFPECYVPFPAIERHLDAFLAIPVRGTWPKDLSRPQYRNGLLLTGLAGTGKSALLARRVEQWLASGQSSLKAPINPEADRENPNLVLFLRGDGIALRPEGISLFRDVAEKLGVSVGKHGIGSFEELFAHLHKGWLTDRVTERRFLLVLDALNEAAFAEQVTREALELVGIAARFPWCKVIVSSRSEWLNLLPEKMGANESDPLRAARAYLYDPEPERRDEQRRLPALALEPLTREQSAEVYAKYQRQARDRAADGVGYAIPACQTPWDELHDQVRRLLLNPLYLFLFMKAFAGRLAGRVESVPDLYEHYVENATERNIEPAIDAVIGHLLRDLTRPSADLNDNDANALRLAWADRLTPQEIRINLSPVEALVHEGILRKRIGEEGGGYRFVYQTVAEYLIYRVLRGRRAKDGDELAHWQRLAGQETVFPEYAGAFQFLFRNWENRDDARPWIGNLVGPAPRWVADSLSTVLEQLAQADFIPGRPSPRVERLIALLSQHTVEAVAELLHASGFRMIATQYAPTAVPIYRGCAVIRESLYASNPQNVGIGDGLAQSLNNLGNLLSDDGRVADAEAAYRRSVQIYESLYAANPQNVEIGDGLARSLSNLGILLRGDGRVADAEAAYRRSVQIRESLYAANPQNVGIGNGLARSLNNLGLLLSDDGRVADAEAAYRRSVQIRESLYAANPQNVGIGNGLALSLNNLGNLLRGDGRVADAEAAYRRSVQVYESLYAANPQNVEIGDGLALSLNNLGILLSDDGRVADAEAAFRRSVQVYESLYDANPQNVEIKSGFAGSLCSVGRWDEAEQLIDELLAVVPRHPYANQLKRYIRSQRS